MFQDSTKQPRKGEGLQSMLQSPKASCYRPICPEGFATTLLLTQDCVPWWTSPLSGHRKAPLCLRRGGRSTLPWRHHPGCSAVSSLWEEDVHRETWPLAQKQPLELQGRKHETVASPSPACLSDNIWHVARNIY